MKLWFFCTFLKWRNADWLATRDHRERRTESKTDSYSKDLLFLASFAFCVITFEPIIIQTCSEPQNDCLNLVVAKYIKVIVEKMTRNCRKMIAKTVDSLVCPFHSIQFSPLGFLPLCQRPEIFLHDFLQNTLQKSFQFIFLIFFIKSQK